MDLSADAAAERHLDRAAFVASFNDRVAEIGERYQDMVVPELGVSIEAAAVVTVGLARIVTMIPGEVVDRVVLGLSLGYHDAVTYPTLNDYARARIDRMERPSDPS